MIRPPMNAQQKLAFKWLLTYADQRGLTAYWSPAAALEIQFVETDARAAWVATLLEVEQTWPGLLTVIQSDPVVRFESTLPMVSVWLGSWARELAGEGFFHGEI